MPPLLSDDLALVILARAPQRGACKTRLARGTGATRAAALYRAMTERIVAHAAAAAPGRVYLACSPAPTAPFFRRLRRRHGLRLLRQPRGDLGARMHAGLAEVLRRHPRVMLMGSDQPDFSGNPLRQADRELGRRAPVWLAPTLDGGYWALGVVRPMPFLFRGPRWGTPRVANHTRAILRRYGVSWCEAPPRPDVDERRDWQRLAPGLRSRLAASATLPGLAWRPDINVA